MERRALQEHLDAYLACSRVRDYCPNGLQVEGREQVQRVLCGVTASQALIEAAIARDADAIMVHHGYFWRGEDGRIAGIRKQRIASLLRHDINLFAYHLPLDLHEEVGNNVQLARELGWQIDGRCGEQDLVFLGTPASAVSAATLADEVALRLARAPTLIGDASRVVRRIGWCTGAAQGSFEQAIAAGVDLYVSGEISEQTVHLARESGVPYLAAGHHATERYGIRALAGYLRAQWGLEAEFLDIDNPV